MKKERNIFMTKLWDSLKNKTKTIGKLAREFPQKTYRELEKYRDADRNEEAQRIYIQQENEELKWEQKYKKEHKLRQEAETETILVKGIGMNSPEMKAANKKIKQLEKRIEELTNPVQKARESGL
jgi:hypothetical protein